MRRPAFSALLRSLFLGLGLLLGTTATWAQTAPVAPHGYDFLTVLTVESFGKSASKVIITPSFQGKSEISLADAPPHYPRPKQLADIIQNTATVNQLLGDLTAAGWEFVQAYSIPPLSGTGINPAATRYLFRKPRP